MAPSRQIGWGREEILLSDILKQIERLTQVVAQGGGGGAGTVTSVSVVSANGFAGSVATDTTTPAITISTTITGLLKGDGTAISAAVAGTDYLAPTGSGAALTGVYLLASGGILTGANTITGTTTNTVKYVFNTLGSVLTNGAGLWLANTTAAAAGVPQVSPSLVLEGQGWKTNATAGSQSVKFLQYVLPTQQAANAFLRISFNGSINGAAYAEFASFIFDGIPGNTVFSTGSITMTSSSTSGATTINNGSRYTDFSLTLGPSGATFGYNFTAVVSSITTGGIIRVHNSASVFTKSSGTDSFSSLNIQAYANSTNTHTGTIRGILINNSYTAVASGATAIGIDINPTGTVTGTELAIRATRGSVIIGGTTLTTSAILDLQSTTRAFIPPRMTTVQRDAIASPSAGMVIYDTTLSKLCVRGAAAWEAITSV